MRRRTCLGLLGAMCAVAARADPSRAEAVRIDRLIVAVGKRSDIRFVRNGKEYSSQQAAEFLRGKLQWRLDKVATVQDFIEQVGTGSTTSGEIYRIKLVDGHALPSADFLRQELLSIDKR